MLSLFVLCLFSKWERKKEKGKAMSNVDKIIRTYSLYHPKLNSRNSVALLNSLLKSYKSNLFIKEKAIRINLIAYPIPSYSDLKG